MNPFELLQATDSSVAVLTGIVAVAYWLIRLRKNAIALQYQHLGDLWTNEGAVDGSVSGPYIFLDLSHKQGEIHGWLRTHRHDEKYSVNVDPGWPWAKLSISIISKGVPVNVMRAKVKLVGNNNRLFWVITKTNGDALIPARTEMWPVPLESRPL
jgi:hypothetical protein